LRDTVYRFILEEVDSSRTNEYQPGSVTDVVKAEPEIDTAVIFFGVKPSSLLAKKFAPDPAVPETTVQVIVHERVAEALSHTHFVDRKSRQYNVPPCG
jgi:hypothetical protein